VKTSTHLLFAVLLSSGLVCGCTTLSPNYERPTVTLSSFKVIPSEGMVPAFDVGLRIINPNAGALTLQGIVYTISLQGHEIVKGVGKDFPVIEGYSEAVVNLTASANLLAGIRFIGDMLSRHEESFEYGFEAKLDMGGLLPAIRVRESGVFALHESGLGNE